LEQLEIMDYSLLIGIHDTKKWEAPIGLEGSSSSFKLEDSEDSELHGSSLGRERSRSRSHSTDYPTSLLYIKPESIFQGVEGGTRSRGPNGELGDKIYYLAIIDVLIRYGTRKKAETVSKSIVHKKEEISAVPPSKYASRFIEFVSKGTI
jgi:1-phosphatidylinositol-4-phosphate 5-kinase